VNHRPMVHYALEAAERLEQELALSVTVINSRFAKPLDNELFIRELPAYRIVATVEDHALSCGFGSALLEMINDEGVKLQAPLLRFGIQDNFVAHASQKEQHQMNGCDPDSMFQRILQEVRKERNLRVLSLS